MTKLNLLVVTENEKQAILKHFNTTETELTEHIYHIRDWAVKSGLPHEDMTDSKIKTALFNCKMSLEKTKSCMKGYYSIRAIESNFFDRLLPFTEDYNLCRSCVDSVIMPRLTPDLCRIHLLKFRDILGKATDGFVYQIVAMMEAELRFMSNDAFLSTIIIIDFEEFGIRNIVKYTPSVNHAIINVLLALNIRIKNIHFLNVPTFVDRIMFLVRAFLPAKFINKLHTHVGYETLHEYIPKEYLPSDYEGLQPSIAKLHEEWCKILEDHEDEFRQLLNVKYQCTLDQITRPNDIIGMGCEGSFKKLCID